MLGSESALDELYTVAAGGCNHATFLRREYTEEGGVPGMVHAAVRAFRSGVAA